MRSLAIIATLLGACTERSIGTSEDKTATQTSNADDSTTTNAVGCTGMAPYCAEACSSDYLQGMATCISGTWTCPAGLVRLDLCPSNTCWGPPASDAETCGPNGWECHPTMDDFASCRDFLCPECTGFDGPVTMNGCSCSCVSGSVVCERPAPPPV
jgi:hypothetical protein